jgi:hypothetical protein
LSCEALYFNISIFQYFILRTYTPPYKTRVVIKMFASLLCYVILYCVILCYVVLCCVMLCYVVLCCVMLLCCFLTSAHFQNIHVYLVQSRIAKIKLFIIKHILNANLFILFHCYNLSKSMQDLFLHYYHYYYYYCTCTHIYQHDITIQKSNALYIHITICFIFY